ncbi:MAG: glycosyltransferase family 39 protein [Candidatus Woesearchaeota archaeon]
MKSINKDFFIVLACMLILFLLSLTKLGLPYTMDEVEFIKAGHAINEGSKYVYIGEQMPRVSWLWHPPLFVFLMSVVVKAGSQEGLIRSFLLSINMLTIISLYYLAKLVFAKKWQMYTVLFLYTIQPLVVQSATLLEIDGTIMTLFIVLFFYFLVKYIKGGETKDSVLMCAFFFLTIWSKLQYAPMLSISLVIGFAYKGKIKGALRGVGITATVVTVFLISWLALAFVAKLDPLAFLANNSTRTVGLFTVSFQSMQRLLFTIWSLKGSIIWIGLPLGLLYIFHLILRLRELWSNRQLKWSDPLDAFVISGFAFFSLIGYNAYGFPKPYVALIPIGLITSLERIDLAQFKKNWRKLIAGSAISIGLLIGLAGDPLLAQNRFYTAGREYLGSAQMLMDNLSFLYLLLPLMVFAAIVLLSRQKVKTLGVSLVVLIATNSIYMAGMQVKAEYSTTYMYGQKGLRQTIDYIQGKDLGEIYASRTDTGFYGKGRYIQLIPESPESYGQFYNKYASKVKYLILAPPDAVESFDGSFILEKKIGDFSIYRANN